MRYTYSPRFYFAHLNGVDCQNGEILNHDHGKYPYLSFFRPSPEGSVAMEYEHPTKRNVLAQPLGTFEMHEVDNQRFYCSEPHINRIFNKYSKVAHNNVRLITEEFRQGLINTFYQGYKEAFQVPIFNELGSVFVNLPLDHKILKIREFCHYCKELSFFEGFAIPRVIYCIGYVQATYFKAYSELVHLEALKEGASKRKALIPEAHLEVFRDEGNAPANVDMGQDVGDASASLIDEAVLIPLNAPREDPRIPIAFPIDELKTIWKSILEIPRCKSLKVEVVETGQEEIELLLSELFKHPSLDPTDTASGKANICHKFDPSWKVPISGLLYATKKRIEKSGAPTGILMDYEALAASKFIHCFTKQESNSKGSNLGRSYKRLKEKLQKYNHASFPHIRGNVKPADEIPDLV